MEVIKRREDETRSRLGMCSVCRVNKAKYTCPACSIKSCSLSCVKAHKQCEGCSGVRNRAALVLKDDMDNLTLLSDYRLLEEIDHKLEDNLRHPLRRHVMRSLKDKPSLPHFLHRLRNEAWNRGTTLKFMPSHFASRRENTSRFNFKEGIIRWHIKWIFHQADVTFTDTSVDENTPIIKLLTKYLEPNNDLSQDDNEKLAYYQSASYGKVAVLMKTDVPGSGTTFQELFMSKSIRLNLANKMVMEYPVLYVVLKHHMDAYLEYQPEGHDDLFSDPEVKEATEMQKVTGLSFFDASNDMEDG
ncbi:box C/D snoRNA protein 1 [Procambarus clarkii]|uniref:box C/D snoRNA protein 1 n=1 Tax=Procambarus clarkii TaxID=6728 RepID=UPI001E670657|nr:box C/D snoRNA protein 1-like [Procambarus clarkii]